MYCTNHSVLPLEIYSSIAYPTNLGSLKRRLICIILATRCAVVEGLSATEPVTGTEGISRPIATILHRRMENTIFSTPVQEHPDTTPTLTDFIRDGKCHLLPNCAHWLQQRHVRSWHKEHMRVRSLKHGSLQPVIAHIFWGGARIVSGAGYSIVCLVTGLCPSVSVDVVAAVSRVQPHISRAKPKDPHCIILLK
jgi:hypothetical protein